VVTDRELSIVRDKLELDQNFIHFLHGFIKGLNKIVKETMCGGGLNQYKRVYLHAGLAHRALRSGPGTPGQHYMGHAIPVAREAYRAGPA
jgi:hypothetical protein